MAKSKKTSPLESFYRLVIMLGSVTVGGMALHVYGPPPEKRGPLVERAKVIATDLLTAAKAAFNRIASEQAQPDPPPVLLPTATPPPSFAAAASLDQLTPTASHAVAIQPGEASFASLRSAQPSSPSVRSISVARALASDPSLAALVARLESAGVDQLELAAWGADGRLVRGSCTAPRAASAFRRMLDSIGSSPREALMNLLARVETPGALAQAGY